MILLHTTAALAALALGASTFLAAKGPFLHRGTIVNTQEVAATTRDEAGRATLRLCRRKETLAVSRNYTDLFRPMQRHRGAFAVILRFIPNWV